MSFFLLLFHHRYYTIYRVINSRNKTNWHQIVGAFWYLLSIERVTDCWNISCEEFPGCNRLYMYCGNDKKLGFLEWRTITRQVHIWRGF